MKKQGYLRPPQVADYFNVSESTLAKWRLRGDGPPYCKLSRRLVVYPVAELDDFIKVRQRQSTSDLTVGHLTADETGNPDAWLFQNKVGANG